MNDACEKSSQDKSAGSFARTHTLMLASVMSAAEARACVGAGVDVVDCKDPGNGALGALNLEDVKNITADVHGRVPVSATVGDLPCRVEPLVEAVSRTAEAGVDFVKVGLFTGEAGKDGDDLDVLMVIEALGRLQLHSARLVAVLLTDQGFDSSLISALARAGFSGVMVDTADKSSGSLVDVLSRAELSRFVELSRQFGLFCGLAGRLRLSHIPEILGYGPDIVGFRGALCQRLERGGELDVRALAAVRRAIPKSPVQALSLLHKVACHERSIDQRVEPVLTL